MTSGPLVFYTTSFVTTTVPKMLLGCSGATNKLACSTKAITCKGITFKLFLSPLLACEKELQLKKKNPTGLFLKKHML